ncbi:hypothetical protein H5410_030665 [Solanum commersonii]|uniref:Uncharacterized protein n=1 Tax=Solanum commersonii TaxID=4109 RepID=A0A9J5YHK9_SOLCO|nr:hypothetical protein H5410_030665 [Solanum commersonii]
MDKELQQMKSQQYDNKYAELSPSEDLKIPELEGDDGKHQKIQTNNLLHAATGSTSATKEGKYIPRQETRYQQFQNYTKHLCITKESPKEHYFT